MDLDSFTDPSPPCARPKEGDSLGSLHCSFEDQVEPTVQSVMPGISPLYHGSMEDNEDSSRNQRVPCMEVGSRVCDHSRGDSLGGISDPVHAGMFSHEGEPPRSTGSLSSRYEAMRILADQQHSQNNAFVVPASAALIDPCMPNVLFPDPTGANTHSYDSNPFSSDLLQQLSPVALACPMKTIPSIGEPPVARPKKNPTKEDDDAKIQGTANGRTIRSLIIETGPQHVYFGRGEPIRNNPGNRRFRSIATRYHLEYKNASTREDKREIRNKIVAEVKSDGSNFIVVVETNGTVSQKPADDERIQAKTGRVLLDTPKRRANFWSWADPSSTTQEPLSWSYFFTKDGEKLELMFQKPFSQRTEVDVTVRDEKHRVNVSWMIMHRVDANVNNINYLVVRRLEPLDKMHGGEPIVVSGECDGQYDPSASAKSSGNQRSGPSGTTTRSSFHGTGGAGGLQSNLYCSLGMMEQSKDESLVFSFEAVHEDVLEEITAVLEEERADQERSSPRPPVSVAEQDTRSTHPPPSRPTDSRTRGARRRGLVNRFCMNLVVGFGCHINLCFGRKKVPTEKAKQSLGIPTQQEAIWLWRESKTRMSRHSSDAIVGDPKDCWVRYDEESTAVLEDSYQVQNGIGDCFPNSKYSVNFELMRQINESTRFEREVRRLESTSYHAPKRGHGTKRTIFDIARKLDTLGVDEADDMTAPTTTADTSMGLDGTMTF